MTAGVETHSIVQGWCAAGFEPLRDELADSVNRGAELGASVAVLQGGELLADLWGGWQDRQCQVPWLQDTVVNVWSLSKVVSAAAALLVADRGDLDLDRPVAEYWPQFAQHGKSEVLVRHVLSHSSGVAGWDPPFELDDLLDSDRAAARLAEQTPWWPPGTASGYHAVSQGSLISEILWRACGRTLTQVITDELAVPLDADFRLGAADVDPRRVADLVPPPPEPMPFPDDMDRSVMAATFTNPRIDPRDAATPAWRGAELGSVNGHSNARAVARIASIFANAGQASGRQVLSGATTRRALDTQISGRDLVLGSPLTWGLGLALANAGNPAGISPGHRYFWGGWGGSLVVVDPHRHLTFAYIMNRMAPGIIGSERSTRYLQIVDECQSNPDTRTP